MRLMKELPISKSSRVEVRSNDASADSGVYAGMPLIVGGGAETLDIPSIAVKCEMLQSRGPSRVNHTDETISIDSSAHRREDVFERNQSILCTVQPNSPPNP